MTPEEQEPVAETETAETDPTAEAPAPTLNRAERRALAKGKKAVPGNANPMQARLNEFRNADSRNAGSGNSRIPRTGHKG